MSAGILPCNPTFNLFAFIDCCFSTLKPPPSEIKTGVSLPYLSVKTTPNL